MFENMEQQQLFEAIRREDVVVFAGAGFSKYAGYPLGGQLGNILVEKLNDEEKQRVNINAPLDYFAEEIVRLKHGSRDFINEVLEEVFSEPPTSTADHDIFAKIPHFHNIITTNYDRLFENAYAGNATLIYRESDVANWKEDGVNILKIHGDLADKSSIILTREDYSTFYRKDYSSPFWATIIKEIATKTILFIGYGYEDPNVWAIFKHVYKHLGDNRKSAYFVGPSAPEEKTEFLLKNGIHYLDHTGASFLNALMENIKDHIFEDMRNKWVCPETFRKFTSDQHLSVSLKDTGDSFQVHSISGKHGEPMHGNMKFRIDSNSDFNRRYTSFFDQSQSDEFVFEEEDLSDFRINVEGLKLFGEGEIRQMSFRKTPKIFPFDLLFLAQGFEMRELKALAYFGNKSVTFKTKLRTLNFQLTIENPTSQEPDARWSMEHDAIYHNVNEEIEVHEFLKYFFSQKTATIYLDKDIKFSKQCPTYDATRVKDAEIYLEYFRGLKEIEKAFEIRFTDFYPIDQESVDDVNWMLQVIHGKRFDTGESMEIKFSELSQSIIDNLPRLKDSELPMELTANSDLVMLLHGQRLPIPGMHTEIPFPEVTNIEELRNGGNIMKVKSRTGSIYKKYLLEPFPTIDTEA